MPDLLLANIIGARPQFIKYFPLARALQRIGETSPGLIEEILIHTGQHYDYNMSKVFFDQLGIKSPDYHLGIGSGSHGEQTGNAIREIEKVFLREKRPDMVVVYGDTNSTLAGALAAVKLHIPVAHIEAGLRSYNRKMPEEVNRVLTDHASSLLFCPTKTAVRNLKKEGMGNIVADGTLISKQFFDTAPHLADASIINTGDVMYDVIRLSMKIAEEQSSVMHDLGLDGREYYMLTLHRAENTDDPARFSDMVDFVNDVSSGKPVIFPMHPRTRNIYERTSKRFHELTRIIDPLPYFDGLVLLKNSALLMTDSGGMQKEAFWLKVPCVTLRDETEWLETVKSGWNVFYKDYNGKHAPSKSNGMVYGDGNAAEKIVATVTCYLSDSDQG